MIQVSFALIQQAIHHIGGLGRCGQRQRLFPAGLQGAGQVLAMETHPEAGLEVAVEDALAVQVQDTALGKATQQGFAPLPGVIRRLPDPCIPVISSSLVENACSARSGKHDGALTGSG